MNYAELYENILIELHKETSPVLELSELNYFINKGMHRHINLLYNQFNTTQLLTDEMDALSVGVTYNGFDFKVNDNNEVLNVDGNVINTTEEYANGSPLVPSIDEQNLYTTFFKVAELPDDYLHMLSCVPVLSVDPNQEYRHTECYDTKLNDFPAKRMTADMEGYVLRNHYMRPKFKNPYYYIENATDALGRENRSVRKSPALRLYLGRNVDQPRYIYDGFDEFDLEAQTRISTDIQEFTLEYLKIKYLKEPERIVIKESDLDNPDQSPLLPYRDNVMYSFIDSIVLLIQENQSHARTGQAMQVNQSKAYGVGGGESE